MKRRKIALTGGIATGKSTVAAMFEGHGALILDADRVAREVVNPGTTCWHQLKALLGEEYFEPDGELRRRRLRECIIRDETCRAQVESILHPAIHSTMEERWLACPPERIVIFDIPLLFEAGLTDGFDIIILAYTPQETQIERLMSRDGLTREQAEETLTIQLPIEIKRSRADLVIDNSRDLHHTREQVDAIWERLSREQNP